MCSARSSVVASGLPMTRSKSGMRYCRALGVQAEADSRTGSRPSKESMLMAVC